jgi:hypothetical protein
MASGEPEVAAYVASYQDRMTRIIIAAFRGAGHAGHATEPTEREATVAVYLLRIWFASLVGWSAGLNTQDDVVQQVEVACELLLDATARW